jgi:hypothetical protein
MPHFDNNFFKLLNGYTDDFFNKYPIFIETGTYNGWTTFKMEPFFKKIHTIEIKPDIYELTKSKYHGDKINFYLGDSSIMLKEICQSVDEPAVFFLDGHWSAGDTGKGAKDCPLYEELENIMKYFKHSAIIVIDDFRLFGKGPSTNTEVCNWEDISKQNVLSIVKYRLTENYNLPSNLHEQDRLILHIKPLVF